MEGSVLVEGGLCTVCCWLLCMITRDVATAGPANSRAVCMVSCTLCWGFAVIAVIHGRSSTGERMMAPASPQQTAFRAALLWDVLYAQGAGVLVLDWINNCDGCGAALANRGTQQLCVVMAYVRRDAICTVCSMSQAEAQLLGCVLAGIERSVQAATRLTAGTTWRQRVLRRTCVQMVGRGCRQQRSSRAIWFRQWCIGWEAQATAVCGGLAGGCARAPLARGSGSGGCPIHAPAHHSPAATTHLQSLLRLFRSVKCCVSVCITPCVGRNK
jgi:hypothetical protein